MTPNITQEGRTCSGERLPTEVFYGDMADGIEKARAMLRQGKPEAFVSRYLGMCPQQVATLRQRIANRERGRPPSLATHKRESSGEGEAERAHFDAIDGSQRLLAAIQRARGV